MQQQTLRQQIARIRSSYKIQSVDAVISDRAIAAELRSTAIAFVKQATDKKKLWNSSNIFFTLPCVEMERVPLAQCCSYTGCEDVARSKMKLPRIAEGGNYGMLMKVFSLDGISRKFIESSAERYANSLDLKLRTRDIHFWVENQYLYVSEPGIESVKLMAYFVEDIDKHLYRKEGEDCCPDNPYDLPFRCPDYLIDDVIKETENKLLRTYKQSQPDNTADRKDDSK